MTQHEDESPPSEPDTPLHTDIELRLEPGPIDVPGERVLHILDQRSRMPILDVKLDPTAIVQLLGGRSVYREAWLLPRPQRDFLGRYRVALTVRLRAGAVGGEHSHGPLERWVEWCRERLAPLGLVDYHQDNGADVTDGRPVPALVCMFVLYPGGGRKPDDDERRALRTVLEEGARSFGLPLSLGENGA